MSLNENELLKVARLARLSLTKDEIELFGKELGRIVEFVAQLSEIDCEGVEPMSHTTDQTLFLREDEVGSTLGVKCVSSSAGYADGLIKVPKIID
ncbi:MAG: Asp-tRNA(Asn)/Glu-tRNA(Gln) amidotransferase subunit GatC [Myxococcales bacterium]|nr:Asp-tRNA(Asn)/Glu-tRNA(Gln) amidotransferase subunit GatC [Myxococcales bacterium]USN51573.1 MAG: Asp-tRNA(Asn)/Glu-tRNA(Gln) amidotransferase subunit GatC [Myxococcales bacterium]